MMENENLRNLLARLERAIENHKENKVDLLRISEKHAEYKNSLEAQKAASLASGLVSGKNDTERKANLAEQFSDLIESVDELERNVNQARLAVELTQLDLDEIRYTLRIYELMEG